MLSALEKEYIPQNRPYSQDELKNMRLNIRKSFRLSDMMTKHKKCNHFYFVKSGGKKEKEIKESGCLDIGNCSVCWKLKKTVKHLKNVADDMTSAYFTAFENEPEYLTYDLIDLENVFYNWLYKF